MHFFIIGHFGFYFIFFIRIIFYYHLLTSSKVTLSYYLFIVGFLLLFIFISNIVSGFIITFYYCPSILLAFINKAFIIHDVSFGWLFIIVHMHGASLYMLFIYLHFIRNLWYLAFSRYLSLWISGYILFILSIIESFIGYCLPFGNMGFHGVVVAISIITSLFSFINISHEIFHLLFCSSYYILCRLFNLHWLIANIILLFIILHLILLHSLSSWSSFLSHWFIISATIRSHYLFFYFILVKDLFSLSFIFIIISILFLLFPLLWEFGNCDNNILAFPLSTPSHIVPEWYFLLFYSFIRGFPAKILGLAFLFYYLFYLLLLGIRNLSSISYTITNVDYYYFHYSGMIFYNCFRAYWTLGLSLFLLLLLFPMSILNISIFIVSIQRFFIFVFIFIL